MGKSLSTSASVVALIALVFHLTGLGGSDAPNSTGTKPPSLSPAVVDAIAKAGTEPEVTWNPARLVKEAEGLFPRKPEGTQFLLASVPDPQQTRLGLFTDTALNTLQQAAFDAEWELAAQWLPWRGRTSSIAKDPSPLSAIARSNRDLPGVIVFRHSTAANSKNLDDRYLFVFIIGETPTAGINAGQFRTARAYMRSLGASPAVRFVGPCFSGSLLSLQQLIQQDQQSAGASPNSYDIVSGTASSDLLLTAFSQLPNVKVHGTTASNGEQTRLLQRVLADLNLESSEAALLVEDESAYSRNLSDVSEHSGQLLTLHYSRNISSLRNNSVETSPTSTDKRLPADIQFSLKDQDGLDDAVPVFAPEKMPAEQNAILNEITSQIRRNSIRLVQISATNVLDLLFLTRVLHNQSPDTRVLVTSPDLLFVMETQDSSLVGTLALSTYPLFYEAKYWLGEHPVTHGSANEEAIYYAARLQLAVHPEDPLPGYAHTRSGTPATWLMVLNRDGFKPLRLFDEPHTEKWFLKTGAAALQEFKLPHPPATWTLLLATIVISAFLLCSLIYYLHTHRNVQLADFLGTEIGSFADAHRLTCLAALLLLFCLAILVFVIPLGAMSISAPYLVQTVSLLIPLSAALWLSRRALLAPRAGKERRAVLLLVYVLAISFAVAWIACCRQASEHAGFFFSYRALEMTPGVSPSVPVLLLLAALFTFAAGHLFRYYLAICHRPRMYLATLDSYFGYDMRRYRREVNRIIAAPINLSIRQQLIGGLGLVALLALGTLTWRAQRKLQSPEGLFYDLLILCMVLLVILLLILALSQTLGAWSSLALLLNRLGNLPLCSSFRAIEGLQKGSPIWAKRLEVQSLAIPVKSSLLLRSLESLSSQSDWKLALSHPQIEQLRINHEQLVAKLLDRDPCSRADRRHAFRLLRTEGALTCHTLCRTILEPEWRKQVQHVNASDSITEPTSAYGLAQSYAALQLSAFINYGVRQIQNLIIVVTVAFSLLVISLNLYPTQSPQAINRTLIGAFVLLAYCFWRVLSQMERDPILSRLSGTTGGELNRDFYVKVFGYAAIPFLSLLTSQFPAISKFVSSWLEPSLSAFR